MKLVFQPFYSFLESLNNPERNRNRQKSPCFNRVIWTIVSGLPFLFTPDVTFAQGIMVNWNKANVLESIRPKCFYVWVSEITVLFIVNGGCIAGSVFLDIIIENVLPA